LPDAAATSVNATCSSIDPSLAMLGANQHAEAIFYSNNGSSIYLTDATNAIFYQLTNCHSATCASISAVTSYDLVFSATKPDFKNLIGDGAGCTFAGVDCDATAYHVLSKKTALNAGAELYSSAPSAGNIPFNKINSLTRGGTPLNVAGLLYNAADSYLYGLDDPLFTGSPTLYRIDANGNAQTVANIPTPPTPTTYTNTYILPAPVAAVPSLQNRKSLVFSNISTATEDGRAYLLAAAYSFDKSSSSVFGYDILNYNLYVAEIGLANPNISFSFYELLTNQPTFSCQHLFEENLLSAVTYATHLSNTPPTIQDWALDPMATKLWAYDATADATISIALPQGTAITATPECYDAAVANNPSTGELNGIHFAQDGVLYAIDGATGRAYSINIANCPPDLPNQCATISTFSSLPSVGSPPVSIGLTANSASCITRTTLPVSLLRFVGTNNSCANYLQWATVSELNNDYFDLQKSIDGLNFATIAKIDGAGTTTTLQTYAFTDDNINKNNYYRLRQIDIDGTAHTLPTLVSLQSNCIKKGKVGIETAFPNPTAANITILYNANLAQSGNAKTVLIDVFGQIVSEKDIVLQEDGNIISLDLKSLAGGVYLFYLKGENWVSEPQRIMKR
ncbi:MAG: hypothetical protein RI894_1626, partial [Bacteroidota bacterium]